MPKAAEGDQPLPQLADTSLLDLPTCGLRFSTQSQSVRHCPVMVEAPEQSSRRGYAGTDMLNALPPGRLRAEEPPIRPAS